MSDHSVAYQLAGCFIGASAIFLPSFLLGIFFFPLWEHLKIIESIRRSLSGINAAVVGIMFAGSFYLLQDSFLLMKVRELQYLIPYLLVFSATLLLLLFTRISSPYIVLGVLFLGLIKMF
jgi:chromate transporter